MKKLFAILLCLVMGVSAVKAQSKQSPSWRDNLKLGVVGGANLTKLENFGGGLFLYFDYVPSWKIGLAAQYKWDGFLSLAVQPELRYNRVVTKTDPPHSVMNTKCYLHMVDLPINFQAGLQLSPIFRPFISVGLIPAAVVGSNGGILEWEGNELSRLNLSMAAGIGFDLWKFQFKFEYSRGITNINKNFTNKSMNFERLRLEGIDFSMGIFF